MPFLDIATKYRHQQVVLQLENRPQSLVLKLLCRAGLSGVQIELWANGLKLVAAQVIKLKV